MNNIDKFINVLYKNKVTKEYAVKLEKIKEDEKISILSDIMFKTMFQTSGREQYPSKFISYYTSYSFEELMNNLIFEKNELDKTVSNKKGLRCDFVGAIDGVKLNIEINNNSSLETMERNIAYAFRLYASKVNKDSDYDYTKVIQFNINNFAFEENDKIIDIFSIQNNDNLSITDKIIIVQIYIPNLRKKWYTNGISCLSEDEKFLLTLVETDIESSIELGKGNDIMENYINEAITASKSEELLEAYDKEWALKDEGKREGFQEGYEEGIREGIKDGREQGVKQGIKDGIEQGIQQGIEQSKVEIVKNMLEKDLDVDLISELTGFNLEEVNTIKDKLV